MITVKIKPREDDRYDMHVGDEGDQFVNSSQGYERVVDAIKIARRLWPPIAPPAICPTEGVMEGVVSLAGKILRDVADLLQAVTEPVVMQVTFRDGKTHTEQLR